ncbi:MAG: hypothetical protein ACI8Z1_003521 [Candidatus Azotimanducaceae bacterium]|jgi:hypothetical protein
MTDSPLRPLDFERDIEDIERIGIRCNLRPDTDKALQTLSTSINALGRMWLGVRPAGHLAFNDELKRPEFLIKSRDHLIRLPTPHFGWAF